MSWIMPFPEKAITGEYGSMSAFRRKNKMQAHSGTDWAPAGSNKGTTAIPAIARGTVKQVKWSNILGWVITQTALTKGRKVVYISYCHLKCNTHGINCKGRHAASLASGLRVGDKLSAGTPFAFIGNTGSASSGPHLHATLSNTLHGVFGITRDKQDLKKAIRANRKPAPVKVVIPKPVVEPVVEVLPSIGGPENTVRTVVAPVLVIAPPPVVVPPLVVAPPVVVKPAPVVKPTVFHKVKPGENLTVIAKQYGADLHAIAKLNNIENINRIFVGQMVRIPDGK
jgi:murein DD-endopeptidase MepM/ murein hydrolase activator NlpD